MQKQFRNELDKEDLKNGFKVIGPQEQYDYFLSSPTGSQMNDSDLEFLKEYVESGACQNIMADFGGMHKKYRLLDHKKPEDLEIIKNIKEKEKKPKKHNQYNKFQINSNTIIP